MLLFIADNASGSIRAMARSRADRPENQETTFVLLGRKAVPSAVPPSFGDVPHLLTDGLLG